ncbi:DUF3656 domain-containing protein [Methanoregula sp.]|uniref:DUF3656 domain-containing U32 family peptidase n=1 Tax=Methanoregula sp. TaxID=2052170 RepID=UPI0035652811
MTTPSSQQPSRAHDEKPVPELLAPAGSPEAFRAAVAAGADAVYLSGKRFGARKFASNFDDDEIREAIRYAHTRGVLVYVTVNTLIHDRELGGVAEYLIWLYGIGADAVLVQDLGVAALAREIVPGLTLHASTQMTIHNTDGVLWAAEHGFSRVVLARELSLAEVQRIAEATRETGIGLEVFAHGALCYGYSGQCLLSSVIGGRSGNRGTCAQPCRKPYVLVTGNADEYGLPQNLREIKVPENYLLSPKDLCTYPRLPELAGTVASVKIEGRMKSPQYVAIVVAAYRRALDAIAAGTWHESPDVIRDLGLAFSRGFTRGYLFGDRHDALMARDAPDNRGMEVGTVTKFDQKGGSATIRLRGTYIPAPGDGIRFSGSNGQEEWGFSLNTIPSKTRDGIIMAIPREVRPGTGVAVTFSRELENRANRIVSDPTPDLLRPVPLDLALAIRDDGSMTVEGIIRIPGKDAVPFDMSPELRMEPARSQPLGREQLAQQLRKTGGSPFAIRNLSLEYAGNLFAPVGKINHVRREILAKAEEALVRSSLPAPEDVAQARRRWETVRDRCPASGSASQGPPLSTPLTLAVYADSVEGVRAAAESGADSICFEPDIVMPGHTCNLNSSRKPVAEEVLDAMKICHQAGTRFILKFPRITRDVYLDAVLPHLSRLTGEGLAECMVEHPGTAHALLRSAPALTLSGASGLNIFNSTAAAAAGTSCHLLTLSPELSGQEIAALIQQARKAGGAQAPAFALIVQGTSEAMVTEDCIIRIPSHTCSGPHETRGKTGTGFLGLRDETGRIFPVRADGSCRTRIGNSAELCLIDHLPAIRQAGINEVVIDARGRPARYTQEMTRIYRAAVDYTNTTKASHNDRHLSLWKEEAKKISCGGITTGHFLRGLKE